MCVMTLEGVLLYDAAYYSPQWTCQAIRLNGTAGGIVQWRKDREP